MHEIRPAAAVPPAEEAHASRSLAALCLVARLHHIAADPPALLHRLGKGANEPLGVEDLLVAARHIGLKAKLAHSGAERLKLTPLPALALMNDGTTVVLAQCDGQRVLLQRLADDGESRPMIEPLHVFAQQWSGRLLLIASRASRSAAF